MLRVASPVQPVKVVVVVVVVVVGCTEREYPL